TTLVGNDAGLLPLAADGRSVLVTGWGVTTTANLAARLGARDVTATHLAAGTGPGPATIAEAAAAAREHDTVVVTTNSARTNPGQAALVDALLDTGVPVVTVAVGVPYDIAFYPGAATHLATYSYGPIALESLARVLFGEIRPRGALPVTVPRAD